MMPKIPQMETLMETVVYQVSITAPVHRHSYAVLIDDDALAEALAELIVEGSGWTSDMAIAVTVIDRQSSKEMPIAGAENEGLEQGQDGA